MSLDTGSGRPILLILTFILRLVWQSKIVFGVTNDGLSSFQKIFS